MKLALLWATYLLESHGEENLQCDYTDNFDCFWMAFVPNTSIQTVYQINQIGKMNFFSLKKLILPIWLIWYTVWVEISGTNAIQKQSKFHNGDFNGIVSVIWGCKTLLFLKKIDEH